MRCDWQWFFLHALDEEAALHLVIQEVGVDNPGLLGSSTTHKPRVHGLVEPERLSTVEQIRHTTGRDSSNSTSTALALGIPITVASCQV